MRHAPEPGRTGAGESDLLENARVQGANLLQIMVIIIAPLLRSSLTSIWLLVFTGTMFELATSELLYPPGNQRCRYASLDFLMILSSGQVWHSQC